VADELHPVDRLAHAHRPALVGLLAHDDRAVDEHGAVEVGVGVVLDLDGHHGCGRACLGSAERGAVALAGVALALGGATQPLLEPAVGQVEGGVLLRGGGLRPDHRTATAARELDLEGPLGQPRVGLARDLDVDAAQWHPEPVELGDLVLDVVAETLRQLDVATPHDDVHVRPPYLPGIRSPGRPRYPVAARGARQRR
jgi:hypothetical protein